MKLFTLTAGMLVLAASASANYSFNLPNLDFEMQTNFEKGEVAKNPKVIAYVKALGARSYKVTNGKPANFMYGIETNNGCKFDVEVVYNDWPGIDAIVVYKNAVCK